MKFIKSTLILLGAIFVLAGCNSHEHTFDSVWSYNDECHWKKATCEHTELTISLGSHTYNSEGFCTVCGKEIASHFRSFTFDGKNCGTNAEQIYHLGDTISFNIIPDEGYLYPTTISVSKGLSNVEYDNKTGIVTGLVTDDIELSAISKSSLTTSYISSIEVEVDGYVDYCFKQNFIYDQDNKTMLDEFYYKTSGTDEYCEKTKYHYNELNQLIKRERSYEDGVFKRYDAYTYNESGTLKDKTTYKLIDEVMTILNYETYSYDELDRLAEIINYDDDCLTPESKEVYTYTENEEKCFYYNYYDEKYEESFYEKTITTIDEINGTKTVALYNNVFPEDISEETLERQDIYDLATGKLIEFYYGAADYYYTYNEMGDLVEKRVVERQIHDDPAYQSSGMKIIYNDNFEPISGTYGQDTEKIYDESLLDFTFNFDDYGLIDFVTFNKKDVKNLAKIKYEYVEISNDVAVPDTLIKAYEPGNYPSFPDTDIFDSLIDVVLN